jgi:phosphoglycolate phosphatase-like HAD superfamily hydrolase
VLAAGGEHAPEATDAIATAYYTARDANLHPYVDVEQSLRLLAERSFTLVAATNRNADLASHAFMAYVAHH